MDCVISKPKVIQRPDLEQWQLSKQQAPNRRLASVDFLQPTFMTMVQVGLEPQRSHERYP